MGFGYGLLRGLTQATTGAQEGEAERRRLEQKALHEALAQSLLKAQINKLNAPPPKRPRAAHYDQKRGVVIYTGEEGPATVEQVGEPSAPTTRNIDPLSSEGIAAAVERERRIAATKPTSQQTTEGERKGQALYIVGEDAFRQLEGATAPTAPAAIAGAAGLVGNPALSAERQRLNQAGVQFMDAYLRLVSGANLPENEVKRKAIEIIPQWGDKPETLQRKAQARSKMLEALRVAAGRAGEKTSAPAQGPSEKGRAAARAVLGGIKR